MNPLVLTEWGDSLKVNGLSLVVNGGRGGRFSPRQFPYDSVVFTTHAGNVTLDAIRWLALHGVPLNILDWHGRLQSSITHGQTNHGALRLRQYEACLDQTRRQEFGLAILREKVRQQENVLVQLARFYPSVEPLKFSLMTEGDEGRIATAYFDQLAKVFRTLGFEFTLRRNATDSNNFHAASLVNALLNFGYSILEAKVRAEANAQGLDTALGFVHSTFHTSEPLVFDLQEIGRWIIDLSVIDLLASKPKIHPRDFVRHEDYSLTLAPETAKRLIAAISLNMNRLVRFRGRPRSYESVLADQIRLVSGGLLAKTAPKFDTPLFALRRDDDSETRNRILSLTASEARRLGIAKTTLWYMQRGVLQGKRRFYGKTRKRLRLAENRLHPDIKCDGPANRRMPVLQ